MEQKCAYCGWKAPVSRPGYLESHFNGTAVCPGSGFSRSQMIGLVGRIAAAKLEALDRKDMEADIWLQQYEYEGKAECGCTLRGEHNNLPGAAFFFCPLHADAPVLLDALEKAYRLLSGLLTDNQLDFRQPWGWTARGKLDEIQAPLVKHKQNTVVVA